MSVVEANTLLLIARRHFKRWRAPLDGAFYISWIAIRVLWFPYVALHLWRLSADLWPSTLRRFAICLTVTCLALLQLSWTRGALKPLAVGRRAAAVLPTARRGFL